MVKLSVNINKFATLRNARGGNRPDVVQAAIDAELFGANGITVHPRPDQRHIRYEDVYALKPVIGTEFNIEGYPDPQFMKLVLEVRPEQVTLVPDPPDVLTSNAGWDTVKHESRLRDIIAELHAHQIRTSIFLDPEPLYVAAAVRTGTDRIELYTEAYARNYTRNRELAIAPYVRTAEEAVQAGLGINAGHDLDLENLAWLAAGLPGLLEVSIGHALVCDALYFGFHNTIQMYKSKLAFPHEP